MTVPGGAASARRAAPGVSPGPRRRVWLAWPLLLSLVAALPARAGHEIPFYPSFYPQEITVLSAAPETALRLLEKKTLHAYVGPDPFKGAPPPAHVERVESLDGYVVLTLNRDAAGLSDPGARCAAAWRTLRALVRAQGAWVVHPYPVTPFHADFVDHFDLVETARKKLRPVDGDIGATPIRVRAAGRTADLVRSAGLRPANGAWDASLEEVSLRSLLAGQESRVNGRPWPPWAKTGWFQAYLLYAGERRTAPSTVQEAFDRRLRGDWASDGERVALERRIVSEAGGECERVVAGYTVRSEAVNGDYSEGVENFAADSQAGLDSAIFVRTVKLKDFPWNGWLTLGADGRPATAW